jgi:DNA end-binding protein Ku
MRPIWKGLVSFGLVSIPVALYSAEAPEGRVRFHQYDGRTLDPVRQKRVNERTGEEVPYEDVVRGFEIEPGSFVTVTDEEIRTALPRSTGTIDVLAFVPRESVPAEYVLKPYYLAPEPAGRKAYALLREVLSRSGRSAIGRFVLRTRGYLAEIAPEGDFLRLTTLRYPHELREMVGLDVPGSDLTELGVTNRELAMAEQLVEALAEEWSPSEYRDEYYDRIVGLLREKATSGEVHAMESAPSAPTGGEVIDLVALLKRSIEESEHAPDSAAAQG